MESMDKPWFAAKRYGLGAGLPISWQGWIVLALFVAAAPAAMVYAPTPLNIVLIGLLVSGFTVAVAVKTKGGWRWRWGDDD